MISTIKIREHLAIYRRYGVPAEMDNRIQFIMNAIDLPAQKIMPQQKPASFTVLYVGRGTRRDITDVAPGLLEQVQKTVVM